MRGLERRLAVGLSPDVRSVASPFISRWDKATTEKAPAGLRNKLGIAIGKQAYQAYRDLMDSNRRQFPVWRENVIFERVDLLKPYGA